MNEIAPRPTDQIARGLAYVCQHMDYIRAVTARRPAAQRAALARLADPASRSDALADLETLHRALRSAGDAMGIFGQEGVRSLLHPVGVDQDESEPVLRCPQAHRPCTRFAQPGPGAAPRCELTGSPLALGELRP